MLSTNAQNPVWNATLTAIRPQKLLSSVPESLNQNGTCDRPEHPVDGDEQGLRRQQVRRGEEAEQGEVEPEGEPRHDEGDAASDRNSVRSTAGMVMMAELSSVRPKLACCQAFL